MHVVLTIIIWVLCAIAPFHMYASSKLFKIIDLEKPEWFEAIPDSSFTKGFPKSTDPNYQFPFIRIVFSPKIFELNDPMAQVYAKCIRVLFPVSLVLFSAFVTGAIAYGK